MSDDADFHVLFDRAPEVTVDAPGRVNLIGEHTDYNEGFVLPTAIPRRTTVRLACRNDDLVRVASAAIDGAVAEFLLGSEQRSGTWLDYVQGCTHALRGSGHRIHGFDASITSCVPVGAGVSSSAALEVGLLRALRAAFALPLDDVALAMIGHAAENRFVGARVGVMDQMAASLCDTDAAVFIDTRSLAWQRVELPASAEIAVIDSGVPHSHAGGEYNTRRRECERAAELLGVGALRDVTEDDLACIERLEPPLDRRARHVVTENARVLAAVDAARAGDAARLGELFYASHASLRDDFEVSVPELDALVDAARVDADVYGARMTGGGFGGSAVILVKRGRAAAAASRVARAYARRTGGTPTILAPEHVQAAVL